MRCRNEEEYIVASLASIHRVFDEIVVVLNNSTDHTAELVRDLMTDRRKIRLLTYDQECEGVGPGYLERVRADPSRSLARYYNWCLDQTTFSHVCKWDGDMIALPVVEQAARLASRHDVVMLDGYDLLGEYTTDWEPRVFRYDPARAYYADWDLYEVLRHNYTNVARLGDKSYLHMKLVKRDWLHREFANLNSAALRSVPPPDEGMAAGPDPQPQATAGQRWRGIVGGLRRAFGRPGLPRRR